MDTKSPEKASRLGAHGPALFVAGAFRALEMRAADIPKLQRFYEANPEYHLIVGGQPPRPDEARGDFEPALPADWPFKRHWLIAFVDGDDAMVGMAGLTSNLFAEGVWHIGLFVVATRLHGSGAAPVLYGRLESWMRDNGARWLRLGVVEGNARAERFWERMGYVDVRKRQGVEIGQRVWTLRVMVKPLTGTPIAEYLAAVARDRPDSP